MGYFHKCYFHAKAPVDPTGAAKWEQCRLEGCTEMRYCDPVTKRRSPCCCLDHLYAWRAANNMATYMKCYHCGGQHGVLACTELTQERRQVMEQHIGYRHDINWWKKEAQTTVTK